ncbi:hypothetical protein BV25DRAFT_1839503 [Artomyces pyxidatus]|uniref:Uncharacterized protein n=1 Tax=Artomyces pyxidatus TaxID=48021 RepID=A0ACB8SXQ3_9AGAM|nr:hypothetical protein BV25DRAFT_1839503 [Artomyces pyxidatus]
MNASSSSSMPSLTSDIYPGGKPNSSKLLSTLRRSLSSSSPKHRKTLSSPDTTPTRHRLSDPDPASIRPTVEQIAMGLHLSRTPHLPAHLSHLAPSPVPSHTRRPSSHGRSHSLPRVTPRLPPPPTRSALKKAGASPSPTRPASSLTMTSASTAPSSSSPSTPTSASTKSRFSRFLGVRASLGASASAPDLCKEEVVVPEVRKGVRFEGIDDD